MNDDQNDRGVSTGPEGEGRVWLTAQRSSHAQRSGLLVAESTAHPARMGPDLAAHIIERYSRPGEWVLDPMCGIGTTVVQATRAGRRAIGVEYEQRWLRIARANLDLARRDGHHSAAHITHGDARRLRALLPADVLGQVALVLTSPPYGPGVHGHVTNRHAADPIRKVHHRYAPTRSDRANLAHANRRQVLSGMTAILTEAAAVLRPGGHVVIVVRPWRDRGVLVDLPEQMITCAQEAGLVVIDRAAALLGRIDEPTGRMVARSSFFQQLNVTRSRAAGEPTHLVAHEDILIASAVGRPGRWHEHVTPTPLHGPDPGPGGAASALPPVLGDRTVSESGAELHPGKRHGSNRVRRGAGIAVALTVAIMTAAAMAALSATGNGQVPAGNLASTDSVAVAAAAFTGHRRPTSHRTSGTGAKGRPVNVLPPDAEPPPGTSTGIGTSTGPDAAAPADVTGLASSAVGQLVIAGKYGCTATVVSSTSGRVAITAAHCVVVPARRPAGTVGVFDALPKGWISPLQFVPGRLGDQAPHGSWDVEQVWVDRRYQETGDFRYDVAVLRLADRDGHTVQQVVGSEGIRFDPAADITAADPLPTASTAAPTTVPDNSREVRRDKHGAPSGPTPGEDEAVTLLGYPVDKPFDGTSMRRCTTRAATVEGPGFYSMACPMGRGSSGGPWLTEFDPATGAGTVVAVTALKYLDHNILYGLRLGTLAHDLYTAADTSIGAPDISPDASGSGATRTDQKTGHGTTSASARNTPRSVTPDSGTAGSGAAVTAGPDGAQTRPSRRPRPVNVSGGVPAAPAAGRTAAEGPR